IFVSSDEGVGSMKKYMRDSEMPWPALRYNKARHNIVRKMSGSGIPCLVVTDRWGNILQHSYQGEEYLGPERAKDVLAAFLKTGRLVEQRLAAN
ncbi:MAG: hypothetical protein F6K30_30640, partial [Cyanothece sp. SIO2G6]|nr:hypothetical protein [Cyanothece sp. SIO2G6]